MSIFSVFSSSNPPQSYFTFSGPHSALFNPRINKVVHEILLKISTFFGLMVGLVTLTYLVQGAVTLNAFLEVGGIFFIAIRILGKVLVSYNLVD